MKGVNHNSLDSGGEIRARVAGTGMRVTLADIAREARVSSATVSRVLNDVTDAHISEATHTRVREAARTLAYTPNHVARALATGKTRLVGLWMTSLSDYYIEIMRHLDALATRDGFALMVRDISWGTKPEKIARAMQWPVDGMVVVDPYPEMPLPKGGNSARPLPVVAMGGQHWADADYVACEASVGATAAVRHLLATGARRVAFMTHAGVAALDHRREVYLAEMRAGGRDHECLVATENSRGSARQTVLDYARSRSLPDAIFCFNDVLAIGAQRALHDLGARMPEDVALVGCDGIEDSEFTDPPLSTIVHPLPAMCAQAWKFLRKRMAQPDLPLQQVTLKPQLVIRGSSRKEQAAG